MRKSIGAAAAALVVAGTALMACGDTSEEDEGAGLEATAPEASGEITRTDYTRKSISFNQEDMHRDRIIDLTFASARDGMHPGAVCLERVAA